MYRAGRQTVRRFHLSVIHIRKHEVDWFSFFVLDCFLFSKKKDPTFSGNPLFEGWYADPEIVVVNDE